MGSKMPNPSAVLPFLGGSRKGKTALISGTSPPGRQRRFILRRLRILRFILRRLRILRFILRGLWIL